jgi:hypothetical protein
LANAYISLHRLDDVPCRFDVVEVWLPHDGTTPRLALHQKRFRLCRKRPGSGTWCAHLLKFSVVKTSRVVFAPFMLLWLRR